MPRLTDNTRPWMERHAESGESKRLEDMRSSCATRSWLVEGAADTNTHRMPGPDPSSSGCETSRALTPWSGDDEPAYTTV
jgi:hypothetical protein